MHLKKYPAKVISDLANWSQEISIHNAWSKDGILEGDYHEFLRATAKFLKMLLKYSPSDIICD